MLRIDNLSRRDFLKSAAATSGAFVLGAKLAPGRKALAAAIAGEDAFARHGLWPTMAWFASLLVLSSLIGFILALCLFLFAFMRIRAGLNHLKAAIYTASGIALMCFMAWTLNRDFPPGLLQEFVNLPWPLT